MSAVSYGELQDAAREQGIDPTLEYEDLHERVEPFTCNWCGDEYITGWRGGKFCSDACEVDYIHEHLQ